MHVLKDHQHCNEQLSNKTGSPISIYNLIIYFWSIPNINVQLFLHLANSRFIKLYSIRDINYIILNFFKQNFCYTTEQQIWALCTWKMIVLWSRMIWKHQLESPSLVALAKLWLYSTLCKVSIISANNLCVAGLNSTSFSPEVLNCPLEVENKVLWEFSGMFALWTSDLACESTWITPVPPTWNSLLHMCISQDTYPSQVLAMVEIIPTVYSI